MQILTASEFNKKCFVIIIIIIIIQAILLVFVTNFPILGLYDIHPVFLYVCESLSHKILNA
jgi:hypothetical protein